MAGGIPPGGGGSPPGRFLFSCGCSNDFLCMSSKLDAFPVSAVTIKETGIRWNSLTYFSSETMITSYFRLKNQTKTAMIGYNSSRTTTSVLLLWQRQWHRGIFTQQYRQNIETISSTNSSKQHHMNTLTQEAVAGAHAGGFQLWKPWTLHVESVPASAHRVMRHFSTLKALFPSAALIETLKEIYMGVFRLLQNPTITPRRCGTPLCTICFTSISKP